MVRFSFVGLSLCGLLWSGAAIAASGTGTSRGQVRQPISINNTGDLNFGTIIRGTTAGTVTINARTAARTRTGGAVLFGTSGFSSATFAGSASPTRVVTFSLGAASITLTNGTGGTMTVNTFRISINNGANATLPRNFTMPANGAAAIRIGGRLNLAANQAEGNYAGTFLLNMNYQ